MIGLPYSTYSPILVRVFQFKVASVALEMSSRKNISWSLYKNFLISEKDVFHRDVIFPFIFIWIKR